MHSSAHKKRLRKELTKKIMARVYIGIILFIVYLPIFYLIVFSFTDSKIIGVWHGFSFSLYKDLFTGPKSQKILSALGNTVLVGFTASLMATIIGGFTAVGIHNSKKSIRNLLNNTNQIPILNAEIVTAVGLLLLFTTLGLTNHKGFWTVTLAHISFCTPYVILTVMPKLKQMNASVYEAALDLGAAPRQALIKVVLPEILPGMISGFLLSFTLSIDDFIITQFTTSSSFQTLSTYIYNSYSGKDGMPPELRALSALLFAIVLMILIAINIKASRMAKKTR